jgi:flagellar protein FliS
MRSSGSLKATNEYQRLALETQVADASPHELVQLMLDGAAVRIAAARSALDAGETALKGELIGKAIGLVEGLRVSLDADRGADLAANLSALYEYMGRRLLEANLRSDGAALDEVADLLRELQTGWREVGTLVTAQGDETLAHSAAG